MPEGFDSFPTWTFLIAWVELEGTIYYQAPMDPMPRRVRASLSGRYTIRVTPMHGDGFDPFIADETHQSRFFRDGQAPAVDEAPLTPTLESPMPGSYS
jgi:hypothetical protein